MSKCRRTPPFPRGDLATVRMVGVLLKPVNVTTVPPQVRLAIRPLQEGISLWVTGRSQHEGVDLVAPLGTLSGAAGDGIVLGAEPRGGYGNWIEIEHEGGLQLFMAISSPTHRVLNRACVWGEAT